MAIAHELGGYTFEFNPERLTIPESKKGVSKVKTYTGSAIFQWPAVIQGQSVSMFWTVLTIEQYNELRTLYLSADTITWDPKYLGVYQVVVEDLKGKYIDGVLDINPHRTDVELILNIRSGPA